MPKLNGFDALETIREVQVLTNVFSAEFGEALGSVTSAVTKAGTNDWHGSAVFFARDEALNAVPAFTDGKPPAGAQQSSPPAGLAAALSAVAAPDLPALPSAEHFTTGPRSIVAGTTVTGPVGAEPRRNIPPAA